MVSGSPFPSMQFKESASQECVRRGFRPIRAPGPDPPWGPSPKAGTAWGCPYTPGYGGPVPVGLAPAQAILREPRARRGLNPVLPCLCANDVASLSPFPHRCRVTRAMPHSAAVTTEFNTFRRLQEGVPAPSSGLGTEGARCLWSRHWSQ